MSSIPDPYKILGVSKDAQIPEIRSAHRKLVLKCHPDKVQDPELKALKQDEFQKVQQAYEILSNEKERQRYDDQVRLAELRKQTQSKANSSSPRTTPVYKYEVRTNDRAFKSSSGGTPSSEKVHVSYSKSYEEEARGPRLFDADVRTVRREASYSDKPSKRELEKERERAEREREKEREKERRRKEKAEEAIRRAEKEFKEARRAEKKAREKERDKDRKRETEDKKKHAKPYIETFEDDIHQIPVIKTEKKKSSSKKHDEKRDRSSHQEDLAVSTGSLDRSLDYAANYIEASRSKVPQAQRSAASYMRHMQPPAAPTPPPAPHQSSPFAVPAPTDDDDARRSSAKPRRGSSGDKSYRKQPSREVLEDPEVIDVSPRRAYHKSSSAMPAMSGSPPRRDLPRTNTMPVDGAFSRPIPYMTRAQTYSGAYDASDMPRGRSRSKLQAQVEETDSDEEYEVRHRSSKHRSSKKHRSPERAPAEFVRSYRVVDGGHTRLQGSYARGVDASPPYDYGYYQNRPSVVRESSYHSASGHKFPKVKMSKDYAPEDVAYSSHYHQQPSYAREYDSVYA